MNVHNNYNVTIVFDDGNSRIYAVVAVSFEDANKRVFESVRPPMRKHITSIEAKLALSPNLNVSKSLFQDESNIG